MAIRVRKDGTMWCAAHTKAEEGDTYIDDGLHYTLSVEHGVLVALPMPAHLENPQWWWLGMAPPEADRWRSKLEAPTLMTCQEGVDPKLFWLRSVW